MGQVLHSRATTTETARRAIPSSQASIRSLAKQYGINAKTVAKWKKRNHVMDVAMGPKARHSTVLSAEEEAAIVAFRKHTLLPLDDCLYALQETIPHLTRSSLHRCLQRHGISRLPEVTDSPARTVAADFLRRLNAAVPYRIHTILTDNGIQFTHQPHQKYAFKHVFDSICAAHGSEHRLIKPNHPWTNGQVERMNRSLKDATVHRYHYETHQQLQEHLDTFILASATSIEDIVCATGQA